MFCIKILGGMKYVWNWNLIWIEVWNLIIIILYFIIDGMEENLYFKIEFIE